MRIAESMYGRRARCVSCGQKMRLPNADEVPADTAEIRLREHPELLCEESEARPEKEELAEPDLTAGEAVPLDVLEELRTLCSLERKLHESGVGTTQEADTRTKLRTARATLEAALQEKLDETITEFTAVSEELVELALTLRAGEADFLDAQEHLNALRLRRDKLARRRENLRGWLACRDPYLAGGYRVEASLDELPNADFEVVFPGEEGRERHLAPTHVKGLRDALNRFEHHEQKLAKTERIALEGRTAWNLLGATMTQTVADRERARAEVAFLRGCLERTVRDGESDRAAIHDQIEHARERLNAGTLSSRDFRCLRRDLRRAARSVAGATRLAQRALAAERARDVPHRGTGVKRGVEVGWDVWLVWSAALVLLACLFVPLPEGSSLLLAMRTANAEALWSLAFALIAYALVLCVVAFVPTRVLRGLLFLMTWLAATVFWALWFHGRMQGPGTAGGLLKGEGPAFQPCLALAGVGHGMVLA
ncbi:MAG TPA: hypothetical protein ENN80_09920, partial [Candidatus Hydrogenedentes bacterium]|nr:hypothetical protein [Candidatus Hydrogenedentota bacterium]